MKEEDAVYEAGRCLHCNLRLCISEVILPPEKWLALTAENVACVPEGEGVYILLDESGKPLKIKGSCYSEERGIYQILEIFKSSLAFLQKEHIN